MRRQRRIGQTETDSHRTTPQSLLHLLLDAGKLTRTGTSAGGIASRQKFACIPHYRHAHRCVSDGNAVVNRHAAFPFFVPAINVRDTDFQLKSGGYAIHGFVVVASRLSAVPMQIDEPRGDHQPAGVDRRLADQRLVADSLDYTIAQS